MQKEEYRSHIKQLMKGLTVSEVSKLMDLNRSGLSSFLHGDDSKISKKNCMSIINFLQVYRLNNNMSSDVCIFCDKLATEASKIQIGKEQYYISTCKEHHEWSQLFDAALKNNYEADSVLLYHKTIQEYINKLVDKKHYKKSDSSYIDKNVAWLDQVMRTKDLSSRELYLTWMAK